MKWSAVALAVVTIPTIAIGVIFLLGPYGGGPSPIKPGDMVEEGDPFSIEELSISAPNWHVIAHKWSLSSKEYQLAFFKRGASAPEICHSGDKFLALLPKMSNIRAVKFLSTDETRQLAQDNFAQRIQVDEIVFGRVIYSRYDAYRQKADHSKLMVISKDFPETAFEPSWTAALFDNFSKGCEYLGDEAPP